uniref:universal stress protein n=1 Tax=Algoriphagus sp. TaxID=1872435 RepID=UPI0040477095
MAANFTILCPIDFSDCSLNALEYASKIGEKYKARLIVFHVLNKQDYQKLAPLDLEGHYQLEFVNQKLKQLQEAVLRESVPNGLEDCVIEISEGPIVQRTLEFSQKVNANLLVVGTEGMNDFKEQVFGSRSSKLVMQTDRDILVIPRKVYFKRPRKLVYATDYVEEDKVAIQKVVEFARFFDSEIDIVHVSSRSRVIDKALHKNMTEEIKPFVNYELVNYVLKSFRDDLALGLENYLQLAKGDMLVTLSKKKDFFDQLFAKNLSRKMSYFLTKPFWVIKSS